MKKIIKYLQQIETDFNNGIYTPLEYQTLVFDICKVIDKNNLNSF